MVLDFFAPWCKACPKAAQHLDHLAESYSERCQFVLICVDGDVDEAVSFAEEHGITRCVVASVVDENAPANYHVSGLPHHTLIAPDGTIARNYEVNLPGDLEEALAKEASNDSLAPVPKKSPISDKYKELEKQDPLLKENPRRWVMFPLQYPEVWEMYKKHEASFWTAEEIDLAQDNKDWVNLTESEQHFVKHLGLVLRLKLGNSILFPLSIFIHISIYFQNRRIEDLLPEFQVPGTCLHFLLPPTVLSLRTWHSSFPQRCRFLRPGPSTASKLPWKTSTLRPTRC